MQHVSRSKSSIIKINVIIMISTMIPFVEWESHMLLSPELHRYIETNEGEVSDSDEHNTRRTRGWNALTHRART